MSVHVVIDVPTPSLNDESETTVAKMSKIDPAHIPAASAPPGFTSNLENPITRDTSAGVALAIVGMVFASFFLGIRVYTKAFLARLFGLDDVLLIFAWVWDSTYGEDLG